MLLVAALFIAGDEGVEDNRGQEIAVAYNDDIETKTMLELKLKNVNYIDLEENKLYYISSDEIKEESQLGSELKVDVGDDELSRPEIEGLPLDDDVLEYIWERSLEYEFDYLFLLAIVAVESNFEYDVKNVNNNGTIDRGLFQINSSNIKWLSELAGIDNVDPYDVYQNIDMALELLNYERNYWSNKGYSGKDLELVVCMAYNMGQGNTRKFLKKHGLVKNKYAKKVYKKLDELKSKLV